MDIFTAAELDKPKKLIYKKDLLPIDNLKVVFREVRDYFAGNVTGITRDEKIAQNIMRLLFCKIFDEKNKAAKELVDFATRPNEDLNDFSKRIHNLFARVKTAYSDIFAADEEIEIAPNDLSFIVRKMETFYLIDANRDIIADAFEELIGTAFRGGEGQFFTPRNIVQMMIEMLQPQSGEKIIDPACGSGGFLAHILQHSIKANKHQYIVGLDKDLFLSKLAKIYLTLLGENEYHIFCENSLENPNNWSAETNKYIQLGSFDLILTNPPFGAKIPVVGRDLLKQYELAHFWNYDDGDWIRTNELREKQPPQILFVERIIQLLKEGGRAGIILPEGIFGNPSDRYVWAYIKKYASITSVVSLSQETFQPSTHTKTSIVFLEKKFQSRKNVFFAIAKAIGHNKNGKETYQMNDDGSFIFNKNNDKVIDDDTPAIAQNFVAFNKAKLAKESCRGFVVATDEIQENIYIPESYKPEIKEKINRVRNSKDYKLVTVAELVEQGFVQIKRGNEIGSQFYGTGEIPFIRTSDIVNWEIKMDTVKSVAEAVYKQYKKTQDIRENDILFVNDGTFLIGKCSMVTKNDIKSIIQSHLRKIRVIDNCEINPFYFFYLLNTQFVQQQVEMKTFVQATLSTLGNRIMELNLPFHSDKEMVFKITQEVKEIIASKEIIRTRSNNLLNIGL